MNESEIEKLYKNSGIEPIAEYCKHQCNNEFDDNACIGCKHIEKVEYQPFTAEKQIELIKWLGKNKHGIGIDFFELANPNGETVWNIGVEFQWEEYNYVFEHQDFAEALAGLVNQIWQYLIEEEKQEIKRILE